MDHKERSDERECAQQQIGRDHPAVHFANTAWIKPLDFASSDDGTKQARGEYRNRAGQC
jgi:hypothetical protein